ncbi:MAG: MBL fold metallo-hydrolase [Bryobacteraceae bacterium]
MRTLSTRSLCAALLAAILSPAAFSQGGPGFPTDLSGEWRRLTNHEDAHERGPGPDPGEYWGLPLNDAERMRADSYNGEWLSTSLLLQCRPHPTGYQQLGPDQMRIEKVIDPINRQLVAYSVLFQRTPGERMIWLDGRDRPSQYAAHSWEGFSLGSWSGDTLTIKATHLKESFIRRNGVQGSFRRTVTEHVSLDEPYLTWVLIVEDPDYLTEPLIRSVTFQRAPNAQIPVYPCAPQQEEYRPEDAGSYRVPHYLTATNPYLTEVAVKYRVPLEGVRGGAATMYPEYSDAMKQFKAPTAQFTLKPSYTDDSTKLAERLEAQRPTAPSYDKVEALHVQGNIFLVAGGGGNVAVSSGGDGVLMVDAGAAAASPKILEAITQVTRMPKPAPRGSIASTFASVWQSTHSQAPPAIRMIIDTNDSADHAGGNANIASSKIFKPIGVEGADQAASEVILSHESVQQRMIAANVGVRAQPTNTYFSERYRLHRFFNGEGVEVVHMPSAITDGDSVVWFRGSDVIATGDIFNSDAYPQIDLERGGSVQGLISALEKITDLSYPEYMGQGGTMIVPGHGWISDAADIGYYRDMVIVVRDRIQDMVGKKMTLAQVKAAKPTMDYDPLYGRTPGSTAKFVEAVYRSLTEKKGN